MCHSLMIMITITTLILIPLVQKFYQKKNVHTMILSKRKREKKKMFTRVIRTG